MMFYQHSLIKPNTQDPCAECSCTSQQYLSLCHDRQPPIATHVIEQQDGRYLRMIGHAECMQQHLLKGAAGLKACCRQGVKAGAGHKDDGRWHTSWDKAKLPEVPSNAIPVLHRQVSYVLHQSQTLLGRHLQPSQMSSGLHQCSNSFWRAQLSLEHNHFVI